jgi:hypothetical protein
LIGVSCSAVPAKEALRGTWPFALGAVLFVSMMAWPRSALALPNTHAPAVSTWDTRASSLVLGLGRAVSGDGRFTNLSFNANFSSTSGILSAQFGAHYVTFQQDDGGLTARGASASGVALISFPLAERHENGIPRSSFAFYIGGVPTALFSGQLNFISVPLVLGVGLPFSPAPSITFRPWVELSPGLNFDTRIQAISTEAAIAAAQDGSLTEDEVEDLVRQGLHIDRETTVGKRAGLSFAVHLGERVDFDLNLVIGAGHAGAVGLGGGLVVRWDAMVQGVRSDRERLERADCAAIAARFESCRLERGPAAPIVPRSAPAARPRSQSPTGATRRIPGARTKAAGANRPAAVSPARVQPPSTAQPARPGQTRKRPAPVPTEPAPQPAPQKPAPAVNELPPLQAAPPKTR